MTDQSIDSYKLKPFAEYKKDLVHMMTDYRLETEPDDEMTKKKKAKAMLERENSNISSIMVKVETEDYKNPLEAFNIIKKNKTIHDEILSNVLLRQQKITYDKCTQLIKNKIIPTAKVKISRAMPKIDMTPVKNQGTVYINIS
jgi:hypothetical protein